VGEVSGEGTGEAIGVGRHDASGIVLPRVPSPATFVGMTRVTKSSASKAGGRTAKTGPMYRGVRIQPTPGPTRFTREQLDKAIDAAIVKNPDAFASGTKT